MMGGVEKELYVKVYQTISEDDVHASAGNGKN